MPERDKAAKATDKGAKATDKAAKAKADQADEQNAGAAGVPKKPEDRKRRGEKSSGATEAAQTKRVNAFGEEEEEEAPQRRITGPGSGRWVAPAFITVGLVGVAWLVVYYIAGRDLPVMSRLGDWNILIGMGLMATSLGLSMLWK